MVILKLLVSMRKKARGLMANFIITNQIENAAQLTEFNLKDMPIPSNNLSLLKACFFKNRES